MDQSAAFDLDCWERPIISMSFFCLWFRGLSNYEE